MTTRLTPRPEYDVKARRISGTRGEKLEQIDAAMQELLDIKLLESRGDKPDITFIAAPRPRHHAFAITVTILLVLLAALLLLVGVRTSHAHDAAAPVERKWKRATMAGELQLATETVATTGVWVSAQIRCRNE